MRKWSGPAQKWRRHAQKGEKGPTDGQMPKLRAKKYEINIKKSQKQKNIKGIEIYSISTIK